VSPKKTIEGSLGALIFSILASLVLTGYLLPEITLAVALLLGLGISVASQLGDLSESLI
jgi:phosphatidate cytidylyltransferase